MAVKRLLHIAPLVATGALLRAQATLAKRCGKITAKAEIRKKAEILTWHSQHRSTEGKTAEYSEYAEREEQR